MLEMHYKINVVHQGDKTTLNLNILMASKCIKPRLSEPQKVCKDVKGMKVKLMEVVTGDRGGI